MSVQTPVAEETIWKGTSSQVKNLGVYALCLLTCWLIVPIFIALWKWLIIRTTVYELTTERILLSKGVFSKTTDTLELYRIKDIQVREPFFLRLFFKGNIVLITSDRTTPSFIIEAVANHRNLCDRLRKQVEIRRDAKRVSELDMDMDVES